MSDIKFAFKKSENNSAVMKRCDATFTDVAFPVAVTIKNLGNRQISIPRTGINLPPFGEIGPVQLEKNDLFRVLGVLGQIAELHKTAPAEVSITPGTPEKGSKSGGGKTPAVLKDEPKGEA